MNNNEYISEYDGQLPTLKKTQPAFPSRISRESFPHQPAPGTSKLPSTKENVEHMLAASGVEVRYDVIKKMLYYRRANTELDYSDLIGLANMNGQNAPWYADFVHEIGRANPINPVREWIVSKKWDGKDRLPDIFATVQAEPDYPDAFKCLLLERWLLSTVAAVVKEDFRTRGVLTLQGPQGCGKTTWIAALVPAGLRTQFTKLDHHLDAHNKDSVFTAVSHWIVEIGELDSSFKKDIARLKGFLTNDCDKMRLPYAKAPIEMARKTVFAASVNETNFLVDQTGNNRFWTIPVSQLDYEHGIDMQQLFAQLAEQIEAGAHWWLTPAEEKQLEEHNTRFKAVSVIEERLLEQIETEPGQLRYMTAIEVLRALGMNNPSNQQCRECGSLLRTMYGNPKRVNGRSQWKVPLRHAEATWEKHDPAAEIY